MAESDEIGADTAAKILNNESEMVAVDDLEQHPQNPRQGNVASIEESIEENGFYGALIVQRSTGRILVGNHRWLAAKRVGLTQVPVIYVDVDDERAKRICLADNRTNDLATYDDRALAELLRDLSETDDELAGTGYDTDDLNQLLEDLDIADAGGPDAFPEVDEDIDTEYRCPKCEYEWSGSPK